MADVMAIVSKAVFEKQAGKSPAVGSKLEMDRYVSANKGLAPVGNGGKLYLVTVRPPNEALWLVAVLAQPTFDGTQWVSAPSPIAITDISSLRGQIKFESGTGITAKPGALGMSLQTPRVLTVADAALLDKAAGSAAGIPVAAKTTGNLDRNALLRQAVVEDPENDLAKQVFADQLMQLSDPRGELVQVELALDGPLAIRKREVLAARRVQLLKEHGKTWFPYKVTSYRTHGGFVCAVTATLRQLAAAPELFANEPVIEVEVTGVDDAEPIAEAPWLPRVKRLTVRGTSGTEGFAALWRAKGAQQLRSLNVTANELESEALEKLDGKLPALDNLVLTANEIGDEGIANLRAWRHLAKLSQLYVSKCGLSSAAVEELLGGGPLPRLAKLTLTGNDLDDQVGAIFAKYAAYLPALRHLELCENSRLGTKTVAAIMKAALPALARLDVRKTGLRAADVAEFGPRVRVQ